MKSIIGILTLLTLAQQCKPSKTSCPERCVCTGIQNKNDVIFKTVQKSSTFVQCLTGGLDERAFHKIMSTMPRDVSVLHIVAPSDKPNSFSITQDFERFNRLTELHLVNCGLTSLAKRTFENVKSLRVLNVANNQLESLTPETFENTEHLLSLNLSGNRLNRKIIPTGAFMYLRNLISLDLSYNNIDDFSTTNILAGLNRLEHLLLDGNVLKSKNFDMLMDVPNLKTLTLNNCRLTEIPETAFSKNPLLKNLGLARNQLKSTFITAAKNIGLLETLDLSDNWITAIADNTFLHSPNLKTLILHGNYVGASTTAALPTTDQSFQQLTQYTRSASTRDKIDLQEVDLSKNGITVFKSSYMRSAVTSLKTLNLSSNNLSSINEDQTKHMNNLKRLYLANTNLIGLPDNLPLEYGNLEYLDISNNSIAGLTLNQTNILQFLVSLDLSSNNFTTLSDYERRFMAKIKYLSLKDNPWDCHHCRTLMNLNMVLKNNNTIDSDDITCGSPPEFFGKSVKLVYKLTSCSKMYGAMADASGESEYGLMVAGIGALTFVITTMVLVICCYAWRKQDTGGSANPNTNINSRKQNNNTEETMTLSSAGSSDHDRIHSINDDDMKK